MKSLVNARSIVVVWNDGLKTSFSNIVDITVGAKVERKVVARLEPVLLSRSGVDVIDNVADRFHREKDVAKTNEVEVTKDL